jgi:hypothetical protein
MNSQSSTSSLTYESARVMHLMEGYSRITNIGECREWEMQAQAVASYMSDTIAKMDQVISVEKGKLEQESSEKERTNIKMSLMQYENFRSIIVGQLQRLSKTIDDLPKGENINEPVSLQRENVTLRKRNSKSLFFHPCIIQLIMIVIVLVLWWYFFQR